MNEGTIPVIVRGAEESLESDLHILRTCSIEELNEKIVFLKNMRKNKQNEIDYIDTLLTAVGEPVKNSD